MPRAMRWPSRCSTTAIACGTSQASSPATIGSRTVRRDRGRRCGRVSPEDAILSFGHLLETRALTEQLFALGNLFLVRRRLLV